MFQQHGPIAISIRKIMLQLLSVASSLAFVLMLYKGVGLVCNTESPWVVVLSGSMDPAFKRGDIIFLTNPRHAKYRTGDIVVYRVPGAEIPIVHRIIQNQETHDDDEAVRLSTDANTPNTYSAESNSMHKRNDTLPFVQDQFILTKGDNNEVDDIPLYNGLDRLQRKHVLGKVKAFLPYVGYASIIMNEMPRVKYIIFAVLGFLTL